MAERIKDSFPEISQIEAFQNAIRNIPKLQFDAAQLKALNEALRPAKRLKSLLLAQEDAAKVARLLEKAISSLKHFRRVQVNAPPIETGRQLPAYRLGENDE